MAKNKARSRGQRIEGLILPREDQDLKPLWKAFEKGSTWYRNGKKRRESLRLRHTAYGGKVRLEWWGDAIRYVIDDADNSGKIGGAFLGHAQRHGGTRIDRLEVRFSQT
ncbi:MAG: hypothetical protein HY294_06370 [Candidatus Rokubacteria bacterium]|nr:hypothetical protein [Candidatus Rokubacteria bacterium]